MALFSSPPATHLPPLSPTYTASKTQLTLKPYLFLRPKTPLFLVVTRVGDNGSGAVAPAATLVDEKVSEPKPESAEGSFGPGGSTAVSVAEDSVENAVVKFEDPKWVGGTWDLKQFLQDGTTNWDAVIDAEVKRRKWLEDNPESSNNDYPVVFDTSIIPWWAWMKRFHLPEAERLNGRAAMIGFFMAYFVDSLTGVGIVDQMGNFFCKTLLFVTVAGVLLFRKNEDVNNLKKLIEETTFYDKQWQATWQDKTSGSSKND